MHEPFQTSLLSRCASFMESCDSPPDWSDDSDVSSHEMNAQTSRPLATELPASAAGEGGATSAVGDEASVQMFSAEVKKEKTEEEPEHRSTLAWLNEKEDGKKRRKIKSKHRKMEKKRRGTRKKRRKVKSKRGQTTRNRRKKGATR